MTRALPLLILLILAWALAGCGRVITKPTPTPILPTPTPTPTRQTPTPTPTASPTPRPATPAPTSTPTPQPTPIIHTIQAGDTLIGLARTYGVTVQSIQEANGITDPRSLLVGQQIIIPTDPSARLSAGTPTPEPTLPPLTIGPLTFQPTARELNVLGQVTSQAEIPLEGVQVQVDLLDDQGQVLTSVQGPLQQDLLLPGDSGPFILRFQPPPPPFQGYQVHVQRAMPAHLDFYHRDLSIHHVILQEIGQGIVVISGDVVNDGSTSARRITITAVLYDAQGQVIAVRRGPANPDALQPGETARFALELLPVASPVADYQLIPEGFQDTDHD